MNVNGKLLYAAAVAALLLCFGLSSCSTQAKLYRKAARGQQLPPGQVKKVTGSQSAAPYAPGQVKKYTRQYPPAPYYPYATGKSKQNKNPKGKPPGHR